MDYIKAFIVGGIICAIAQILMDKTKLTPARILVLYVSLGAILGGLGIYEKLINFGGAGATIPLLGFGNSLSQGVIKAIDKDGIIGIFTGGLSATAGGISAAVFFGYVISLIFNPKSKK